MKVLQINCTYAYGSTGKITQCIHKKLLEDGFESVVLYGRGPTIEEKGVYRVCSNLYGKINNLIARISGIRYGGCRLSTRRVCRIIKMQHPDVVHLQCINGYFINIYRILTWLKENNIPTVLTLHAEFMYTGNCGHSVDCNGWLVGCKDCPRPKEATKSLFLNSSHQNFMRISRAFSGFEQNLRIVSVSPWLMQRARQSPVLSAKKHCVILNGIDTTVFHTMDVSALVEKHKIKSRKIIFHVTAMFRDTQNDPKGGWYILKLAERMKNMPVLFVVAGKHQIDGNIPDNVLLLGEIKDQECLAKYYNLADLTVITSKRETYSMVCVESLCCGTPVIGFEAGAPEEIALPGYSCFVPNGDIDALEDCVCHWLDKKRECQAGEIEDKAAKAYAQETMVSQYEDVYHNIMHGV